MGIIFDAFIAFDDDTPAGKEPFSHDPGVWSLTGDYGLALCGDRRLFAALGYPSVEDYPAPLIPLRGLCQTMALPTDIRFFLEGEDYVGWLNVSELFEAIRHASIEEEKLCRPIRVFLGAVRYLESVFGEERVRVIFAFIP